MTKRIQVKETKRYWGDFEGSLESIISQLQSELDDGWEGIENDFEPYDDYSVPYLYKHRPENDKEYAKRMKELEKEKERKLKAKEKRRQEYEKLKTVEQMTDEEWEVYINHSDYKIVLDIADHKDTPPWVLERLVSRKDPWICFRILQNPSTTSEILDKMMDAVISQNPEYISHPEGILIHPKCSEKTILKWNSFDKLRDHLKFYGTDD